MSKRRPRERRRAMRTLWGIVAAIFVALLAVFVWLAPADHERPLVTVYMEPGCESCRRWMRHLSSRGFRTQTGTAEEWMTVRGKAKVPRGFDAPLQAMVQGLVIQGHVPAGDIHRALRSPERESIRALVVPGAPPGAPGTEAALKLPYVVFAMDTNGLLRPWATHNHIGH